MTPDPEDEVEEPGADEGIKVEEATALKPGAADAASKRGVRRQALTAKRKQRDAEDFYRQVFKSEVGRREMWTILMALGTFVDRFAASPTGFPDNNATWFYAGQKASGQAMFKSWIKLDRDGVMLMLQEHDQELRAAE